MNGGAISKMGKNRDKGVCVRGGYGESAWNPEVLMTIQVLRGQLSNAGTTASAGVVAGVTDLHPDWVGGHGC